VAYIALQTLGASDQMVGISLFGLFIFLTVQGFWIRNVLRKRIHIS